MGVKCGRLESSVRSPWPTFIMPVDRQGGILGAVVGP